MAKTFWMRNGKIVANADGKPILCDHCPCAAETCCLYPWPDPLGTPLYPSTDLPDNITDDEFGFLSRDAGYSYGSGLIAAGTSQWERSGEAYGNCLINGHVSDNFADTYTGTYGVFDPITLTRNPLNKCIWEGEGTGTEGQHYTVQVIYNALAFTDYKWHVRIQIDLEDFFTKADPQSSPEGDYGGGVFTVS